MSRVFIESFFPAIITKLRTAYDTNSTMLRYLHIDNNSFDIFSILFPNEDVKNTEVCRSEISATMSMHHSLDDNYFDELHLPTVLTIRNPVLCLSAILGAIIGLYVGLLDDYFGLMKLYHRDSRRKKMWSLPFWSMAFLFFGFMNLAAIPLHCYFPMKNDTVDGIIFHRIPLPQQYPLLWMMDTFCTGVFSASLIAALYTSRTMTNYDAAISPTLWNGYQYMILIFLCGCTATYRFLIFDSSIELELWYILPLSLAAFLFARELMKSQSHHAVLNQNRTLLYYYIVALVWLFSGIFVDPLSCRWTKHIYNTQHQSNLIQLSWWWDFTRLPAIAFGACDLVFIGLYHHLRLSRTLTTNSTSKAEKYK